MRKIKSRRIYHGFTRLTDKQIAVCLKSRAKNQFDFLCGIDARTCLNRRKIIKGPCADSKSFFGWFRSRCRRVRVERIEAIEVEVKSC